MRKTTLASFSCPFFSDCNSIMNKLNAGECFGTDNKTTVLLARCAPVLKRRKRILE